MAFSMVSSRKVQPKMRRISSAQFRSGSYDFPYPYNFPQPAPYRLPMLEPDQVPVSSDTLNTYTAVEVYQIGSSSDPMTATFPIQINTTQIPVSNENLSPLGLNQSVVLIIYKNQNVRIEWALSNISNNGMLDDAIKAQNWLAFEVTNIAGTFRVTRWINPAVMYPAAGGDLSSFYPTPTIANNAITSGKIATGAVTQAKIASGAVGADQLATGAVTGSKLALLSVGTANLTGKSVTPSKLSDDLLAATAYIPLFAGLTNYSPYYSDQSDSAWISSVAYQANTGSGEFEWIITPKSGFSLVGMQATAHVYEGIISVNETTNPGKITVKMIFFNATPPAANTKIATLNAYIKS